MCGGVRATGLPATPLSSMSFLQRFRDIQAGLSEALEVEDGEVDEHGNFVVRDGIEEVGSDPADSAELRANMFKERYERAMAEFEKLREDSAAEIEALKNSNATLLARVAHEQDVGDNDSNATSVTELTEQLEVLQQSNKALQEVSAKHRQKHVALCEQFDTSQKALFDFKKRWERLQEKAAQQARNIRQRHPDLEIDGADIDAVSESLDSDNVKREVVEDLMYLKQAINDSVVKLCAGDSGDTELPRTVPEPLDLHAASAKSFAELLQHLVKYIAADQLQNTDPTLQLQFEQLKSRFDVVKKEAADASKAAQVISTEMTNKLLRAADEAETLRQQRAASEARQDQLMDQVTNLCREKDEALEEKKELHNELAEIRAQLQNAQETVTSLTTELKNKDGEIQKLASDLEKKNVTWDEYALFQARLEESEDLCKQQAEKLAVHVLERDEAIETVEQLRQQQSVLKDRIAALTSDIVIRDQDIKQTSTQLANLNGAMQRLEIEGRAQQESLQSELDNRAARIEELQKEHEEQLKSTALRCQEEAASELRLRDLKLEQQANELQAAMFARDSALRKLRESGPDTSVDRRLVATMMKSFFKARGSSKKQLEILGLVAKILDDPELVSAGAPQSIAGKAGNFLGSLWRRGSTAANTDDGETVGDLWLQFLMQEAGGEATATNTGDSDSQVNRKQDATDVSSPAASQSAAAVTPNGEQTAKSDVKDAS